MKPFISIMALVLGGAVGGAALADEQVCMSADEMKASLIDWYGERPVSEPSDNNAQIWASAETGTWTMIKTHTDGSACVIAQGTDWMPAMIREELIADLGARTAGS